MQKKRASSFKKKFLQTQNSSRSYILNAARGENPFNESFLPKKVVEKIDFFRYPDALAQTLREKIAIYTGYKTNNILCTNGSDEALMLLMRYFTSLGDEIVLCPPTFFNYTKYVNFARAKVLSIPRKSDFSIDTDKILSSITPATKMIVIDSPGNPCGATVSHREVVKLLKTGLIVLIDEAYFEYCQDTVINLVRKYPNLVITRSFSKWSGLAGLRVGYIVASENIISELIQMKLPCNVNAVGQYFASYALDHKNAFLKRLKRIISLRELAINKLRKLPKITVYSSNTAFIVVDLNNLDNAQKLQTFLEKNKILIHVINQPLLENSIRVNFSNREDIDYFCSMLKKWIVQAKIVFSS